MPEIFDAPLVEMHLDSNNQDAPPHSHEPPSVCVLLILLQPPVKRLVGWMRDHCNRAHATNADNSWVYDMVNVLKYACFGSELKILPRDWFWCDSNFFLSQTNFHLRIVRASGRVQEARNSEKTVFRLKALFTSSNGVKYYFRLLRSNPLHYMTKYMTHHKNSWHFHVTVLATPSL